MMFLVGDTSDYIAVPDPLGLREIMKANGNDKATKVWGACLAWLVRYGYGLCRFHYQEYLHLSSQ
jgi:hypothetical protein